MKITIEGKTPSDLIDQLSSILEAFAPLMTATLGAAKISSTVVPSLPEPRANHPAQDLGLAQGPGPEVSTPGAPTPTPVDKPVDTPKDNSGKKPRSEKQLANDARLAAAAAERLAKTGSAAPPGAGRPKKAAAKPKGDPMVPPVPPPPKSAEGMDPAEVVRIRQKTIEDLQSAYANGHQQEVFELLSRFGNGAKSFRELPPESFVPIREAIDNGALK